MIHRIVESLADDQETLHERRYNYYGWPQPWLEAYEAILPEFADVKLREEKARRLRRREFDALRRGPFHRNRTKNVRGLGDPARDNDWYERLLAERAHEDINDGRRPSTNSTTG